MGMCPHCEGMGAVASDGGYGVVCGLCGGNGEGNAQTVRLYFAARAKIKAGEWKARSGEFACCHFGSSDWRLIDRRCFKTISTHRSLGDCFGSAMRHYNMEKTP